MTTYASKADWLDAMATWSDSEVVDNIEPGKLGEMECEWVNNNPGTINEAFNSWAYDAWDKAAESCAKKFVVWAAEIARTLWRSGAWEVPVELVEND